MTELCTPIKPAGLRHVYGAAQALNQESSMRGLPTVNSTVPKPLCRNGDGRPVHARSRCKSCYELALASGVIIPGAPTPLPLWSPDWTARALCNPLTADGWFPDLDDLAEARPAKRVCARCPVRQDCLELALTLDPPPEGIWGGLDEAERQLLRRTAA